MHKKKTFFDEDIVIEEKLFDNFKLDNIASWSHLELWCTIQNVEVNYAFFKGILCGAGIISKLYDIILDAIENTEFLDKFIDNPETIQIIEKLFVDSYVSRTYKAKEFWIDIVYKQDYQGDYMSYWHSGTIVDKNNKYKLLNAIFKKTPMTLIAFYDKDKFSLHLKDPSFVNWLVTKCKALSLKNNIFSKIYDALCIEIKKQNNISMYMN